MGQLIRICILGWSAALLTASYAGTLSKMDPTFIATVFTASAATFGINTMKKSGSEDEENKSDAKSNPEPIATPYTEPSIEYTATEPGPERSDEPSTIELASKDLGPSRYADS